MALNDNRAANRRKVLRDVLDAARARDYSGYSKFDALNGRLLKTLSLNTRWGRLLLTQAVKECPLHVRPLLGVRPSRNPKGIALFARALLIEYEKSGQAGLLMQAEELLDWLLDHPSPGRKRLCWGYNFVWESPILRQDRFEPNAVVTSFVGEALAHACRLTSRPKYLEAVHSTAKFMVEDLPVLYESATERAVAYVLTNVTAVVLNNQVLTGAFLAKAWQLTGDRRYLDIATRQLTYTWNRRTAEDCWYYTHPRNRSPIRHDNYHTGGILDGFLEFAEVTGDKRFDSVYWQALAYYREHLFDPDGAPRWMNDRPFPRDVHGSAQGIITFAKASRHRPFMRAQAERIADWAIDHLYRPGTRDFIYRRGRHFKWNYSLMRWCNAWMARALAELDAVTQEKDER
jgi:rhamnogalacturonyl hydrolase YesR